MKCWQFGSASGSRGKTLSCRPLNALLATTDSPALIIYLLSASESSLSLSLFSPPSCGCCLTFLFSRRNYFDLCSTFASPSLCQAGNTMRVQSHILVKQRQTEQDTGGQILCDVWRALITCAELWRGYDWSWMFDKLLFTPTLCEGKSMRNWRFGETR